ncbi:hypothetical protein PAPYR_1677 [Paratrimastix pyriformis]|uniref:Uncharacterized protein n=1 Tax=Paratrimastix pyriformis TaxID=342808 RepID=A0ABQ8UUD9_9EUKA|nr:hypothetical protein PAPYR_1677 [Paratrimastix pyriformis]
MSCVVAGRTRSLGINFTLCLLKKTTGTYTKGGFSIISGDHVQQRASQTHPLHGFGESSRLDDPYLLPSSLFEPLPKIAKSGEMDGVTPRGEAYYVRNCHSTFLSDMPGKNQPE